MKYLKLIPIVLIMTIYGCAQPTQNNEAIDSLRAEIDQMRRDFANQPNYQDQINNLTVRLAELENNSPVIEIIDPCGDGIGVDEIILRLGTGELIAYFEQGGNRFLTVLKTGRYQTTDQSRCVFDVTSDGKII